MDRFICIHGHFYQPPRENPWLEAVEIQETAHPFHDWNERVTEECYARNAKARVLASDGRLERVTNNYSRMSFNMGPTLLSWLEQKAPETYSALLQADKDGVKRFSGHGTAIAQCYSHMIMPLANSADKRTQVAWGVYDFLHRFGRQPEGMWLPEAAVDIETLSIMASYGIKFVLLAPRQALRVRPIGASKWQDIVGESIDSSRPYTVSLPDGQRIAAFFYDGPMSNAIAFEGLLNDGHHFADRLRGGLIDGRAGPQLANVATDGESYGHHHRHGEMALAAALGRIESSMTERLTVYGEFLHKYPPQYEVQVVENSSWSCVHGSERWKSDCGCNAGRHAGFRQHWREPLREALNGLRDELAESYSVIGARLFRDPWAARNAYISVVLDRSPENIASFMGEHLRRRRPANVSHALKLLESQRHAMLMFTSCGWFFDDLAGLETIQVMRYASRASQLSDEVSGGRSEQKLVDRLESATSNVPAMGNGADIYRRDVVSVRVTLRDVGAHYIVNSLLNGGHGSGRTHAYDVDLAEAEQTDTRVDRRSSGRAKVLSRITHEEASFIYTWMVDGASVSGNIREVDERRADTAPVADVATGTAALKDPTAFGVKALLTDERRAFADRTISEIGVGARGRLQETYEADLATISSLLSSGVALPEPLRSVAATVLTAQISAALVGPLPQLISLKQSVELALQANVPVDMDRIRYRLGQSVRTAVEALKRDPADSVTLEWLITAVTCVGAEPFGVDLWWAQVQVRELILGNRDLSAEVSHSTITAESQELRRSYTDLAAHLRLRIA